MFALLSLSIIGSTELKSGTKVLRELWVFLQDMDFFTESLRAACSGRGSEGESSGGERLRLGTKQRAHSSNLPNFEVETTELMVLGNFAIPGAGPGSALRCWR